MSELKSTIEEWVALKSQITEIRKDVSVLVKREKVLSEVIKNTMTSNDVEDIKLGEKKVRLRTKEARGGITKEVIKNGLMTYFSGDVVKVEGAMKSIIDSAPVKQRSSLSLLGKSNGNQ